MIPRIPSLMNTIVMRSRIEIMNWKKAIIFRASTNLAAFYVGGGIG